MFFADRLHHYCLHWCQAIAIDWATGVLSGGELKDLYTKSFVVFEAEPPSNYLPDDELRKFTRASFTPVFVFLDASGRKVHETRGFVFRDQHDKLHCLQRGTWVRATMPLPHKAAAGRGLDTLVLPAFRIQTP